MNVMKDFELKDSSSSCKIEDIESFVYGPFTSRFWMLRKHIFYMDKNIFINDPPFFGWDCITLNLKDKWDVHLIIRSEKAMSMFLKFLIHHMETLDGFRGSSTPFQGLIYK